MIVPDKFHEYAATTFSLLPDVLEAIETGVSLRDLAANFSSMSVSAEQLIAALDILFLIGEVELDHENERVSRA